MIGRKDDLEAKPVPEQNALKTVKRIVYSPNRYWDSHVMRIFSMTKDGRTLEHQHPWPHWTFGLDGRGTLVVDGVRHPLEKGSYAFVPPEARHCFENSGEDLFEFICIVPKEGDQF